MADDFKDKLRGLHEELRVIELEIESRKVAGEPFDDLSRLEAEKRKEIAAHVKSGRSSKKYKDGFKDYSKLKEEVLAAVVPEAAVALAAKERLGLGGGDDGRDAGDGDGGEESGPGALQKFKDGYRRADQGFRQAQRNVAIGVKKSVDFMDHHAHAWIFALVCLLVHAYDASTGFNRGGSNLLLMITAYTFIALYAALFYYNTGFTTASGRFFVLSLIAVCLPLLRLLPYFNKLDFLIFILTFLPVWFLYVSFHAEKNKWLQWTGKIIVFVLIIIAFILLLGSMSMPDIFTSGDTGAMMGVSLRHSFEDIGAAWSRIKERFVEGGVFCWSCWRQRLNSTFNPYAQFYTGEVEQNKEAPLGVYITKLEPLYPTVYLSTGVNPVTMGRIEAKTFVPGGVIVNPSCRLEKPGKPAILGRADPEGPMQVNYNLVSDVICTYDLPDDALTGQYDATLGLSFDFQTWAYITNTFVAQSLIQNYLIQDRDVNRELAIDKTTSAVYTSGPVALGISADSQPIAINPDAKDENYIQQRFGFTLTNRWSQGEIQEVREAKVIVPAPFLLKDCLPTKPAVKQIPENKTTIYTFSRDGLQFDSQYDYRTVTCKLALDSKEAAEEVLAFGEKTPVTFVVLTTYTYQLEKKTRFRVEK